MMVASHNRKHIQSSMQNGDDVNATVFLHTDQQHLYQGQQTQCYFYWEQSTWDIYHCILP